MLICYFYFAKAMRVPNNCMYSFTQNHSSSKNGEPANGRGFMGLPTNFRPITARQAQLVGSSLTFRPLLPLQLPIQLPQFYLGRSGSRTSLYRIQFLRGIEPYTLGNPTAMGANTPNSRVTVPVRTWAFHPATHMATIIDEVSTRS